MTTCKILLTPTNKEQQICHVLATTSAFNLKLCPTVTDKTGLGLEKCTMYSVQITIYLTLHSFSLKLCSVTIDLKQSEVYSENKPAAQAVGADPSRCNSTNRQNSFIQQNRRNF